MEVRAIPVDQQDIHDDNKKHRRLTTTSEEPDLTYGGHPSPVLDTPYEPVLKDKKDMYHSITLMKVGSFIFFVLLLLVILGLDIKSFIYCNNIYS